MEKVKRDSENAKDWSTVWVIAFNFKFRSNDKQRVYLLQKTCPQERSKLKLREFMEKHRERIRRSTSPTSRSRREQERGYQDQLVSKESSRYVPDPWNSIFYKVVGRWQSYENRYARRKSSRKKSWKTADRRKRSCEQERTSIWPSLNKLSRNCLNFLLCVFFN